MFRFLLTASLFGIGATSAMAQDAPQPDIRIQRILEVLRAQPAEASAACLEALKGMHNTEDALQVATSHQRASDIDLANDVLETDYQNVTQVCGADATRVCNSQQRAAPVSACTAMRTPK